MPNIRPARYIKIYADTTKGAIFFENSVVEPKFLGTIEASIKADEPDQRIVIVRNDRLRADGVTFRQIFRRLNFYRVQNADGQYLHADLGMTIAEVVDYINAEAAKSVGGAAPEVLFSKLGIIDFHLDSTQTSTELTPSRPSLVMMDSSTSFRTVKQATFQTLFSTRSRWPALPTATEYLAEQL